ncbi:signal peptide peptidase SppA [Halomarina ordinaria]|uniref:Signal peptide peptidase SppA n=1 Tax=Halomarina ordinaria TaxID=3033939 RepID=A0ABD5U873_9EURY|nr:signal peptide peptidase SppA [Halomarina sp. PSRA2]
MATQNGSGGAVVRTLITLVAAGVAAVVGFLLFVVVPDRATAFGVLLALLVGLVGARVGQQVASRVLPGYNVAEVAVEGPISRSGRGPGPTRSRGTPADDVVDQIEAADDDDNADALLLKLNTPGGEVLPSDDIRLAAAAFDGPTVAYATDTCASGGYWIASGCDELWARETSVVGSIGVIGSRVNAKEFADDLGLQYERFAAGRYKDAGTALKEVSDDERAYLQGLIDDYYDHFVERVAEGRELSPDLIRDTEARVYLGEQAFELGLVDRLGTRDDVVEHVEDLLGTDVSVATFEPQRSMRERLSIGAESVAYAVGAGIAGRFGEEGELTIRL